MSKRITSLFALSFVAILLMGIALSGAAVFAEEPGKDATVIPYAEVSLYLDNEYLGKGMQIDSVTYIPLCGFCEIICNDEVNTTWDSETATAVITTDDIVITVNTGNKYFSCNNRYFYVQGGIYNINGTILVPARDAAKIFGLSMEWNSSDWSVNFGTENMAFLENGDTFYDEEDLFWLSRAINAEAGNQPMEGKIGVGNVIINRVNYEPGGFGDSIIGVIFQTNQFSVVKNGSIYLIPDDDAVLAAKFALEGYNTVGESLYFLNPRYGYSPFMDTQPFVCIIGEHYFYA